MRGTWPFSEHGMKPKHVLVICIALIAAVCTGCGAVAGTRSTEGPSRSGDAAIAGAFQNHQSGIQVTGKGVVTSVLSDDNVGGRHQRFIVELASGQTLLFAHNIDIAPRLNGLAPGDSIEFSGEYEWNAEGGVIHWTHHDPSGQHRAGWLIFDGATYQ